LLCAALWLERGRLQGAGGSRLAARRMASRKRGGDDERAEGLMFKDPPAEGPVSSGRPGRSRCPKSDSRRLTGKVSTRDLSGFDSPRRWTRTTAVRWRRLHPRVPATRDGAKSGLRDCRRLPDMARIATHESRASLELVSAGEEVGTSSATVLGTGRNSRQTQRRPPGGSRVAVFESMSGGVLLSHEVPLAVPSAQSGLASGFGMGPGVSPTL
jgi:hypothetical protein